MKGFFENYHIEIVSAVVSLTVTILTIFLSHFLDNAKLRYKQKMEIVGALAKKKYEGITKIRSAIEILAHYENLAITEDKEFLIPEFVGRKVYTPSSCYDYENLLNISSSLNTLYAEYGYCLRHTCVLYLVYIRNFFMDYIVKCKEAGLLDEELRWGSVPLYPGIFKWYKLFDRELIRTMNKPSTKYYAHSGVIYNILLKIYGLYFNRTTPFKYINDKDSILNNLLNDRAKIMEQYEQIILENAEEIFPGDD